MVNLPYDPQKYRGESPGVGENVPLVIDLEGIKRDIQYLSRGLLTALKHVRAIQDKLKS